MLHKLPKVKVDVRKIPFHGGLDTETPMMEVKPGKFRNSQNIYEGVNGGYYTFQGYERFDGRTAKPSLASYATLAITKTGAISLGDVLTDNTAAAYGTVIAISDTQAVLTKITGTFAVGNIKVGAAVVGTCSAAQINDGASTSVLHAQYNNLAADIYRDDIGTIGGASCSGSVLGIQYYDGAWYAFRNNSGGTATLMYKSTTSGWTQISLGYEVDFTSGGTYEISEGDTITGHTSTATADVERVIVTSGTWSGGDAAGRLILSNKSGTFQSETLDVDTNIDVATIGGDISNITIAIPSGHFEFKNYNFTASLDTLRMYGCDGNNRGFEFDGSVYVPIETGMTSDTPEHITIHKNQLFFSFLGVIQHSAPGDPYDWTLLTGASEIGLGDQITALIPQKGTADYGALTIYGRNSYATLYGNDSTDWILDHNKEAKAGAILYSAQRIGATYSVDDSGIISLYATDKYGNFADSVVSNDIQSYLTTKKNQITASCVIKSKSQYWLFFADKSALCCTINKGKIIAMCPMLLAHKVTCICVSEDSSGNETIMFGSDNGYVYQMNIGTSLDGDKIEWYGEFSYVNFNMPTIAKKFRKIILEIIGSGYSEYNFGYNLSYADSNIAQPDIQNSNIALTAAKWDSGVLWDDPSISWDTKSLTPESFRMTGIGINISITLSGNTDYSNQLKFSNALIHFTPTKEIP